MKAWLCVLAAILVAGCGTSGGGSSRLPGPSVTLSYNGRSVTMDLTTLPMTTLDNTPWINLATLLDTAALGVSHDKLLVSVESFDGYRPEQDSDCASDIPLDGATLDRAYISPASRNLRFESSLNLPSCMNVENAATLFLQDKPTR